MEIGPIDRTRHFQRGENSRSDSLRDPGITDLPKVGGGSVSLTNIKIQSSFARFLGINGGGEEVMKKLRKSEPALFASEDEFKKCVGELADAFVADMKDKRTTDLEPFDAYAEKVRLDFYLKSKDFRERFINGFKLVQGEENKDKLAAEDQKNPPPGTITL